jgi:putative phage-type endonuclease
MKNFPKMRLAMNNVQQDTPEWHAFRGAGVGASEIAAVIGVSPWMTKQELWELKTGLAEPRPTTAAMEYGKETEEGIRVEAEKRYGVFFTPACVVHSEYDCVRASLDGISPDGATVLECKTCSADALSKAKLGVLPPHYIAQVQYQLACCPRATKAVVVMFHAEHGYAALELAPDVEYQKYLVTEAVAFWSDVLSNTRPKEDSVLYRDDAYLLKVLDEYADVSESYKAIKARHDALRDEIKAIAGGVTVTTANGWQVKAITKTLYDYRQACVDANVDVTGYGKQSVSYTIKRVDI